MSSLTSPLGLTRHLRRPDLRLETLPWLNVLLVGLLLWLLGPRYIFQPGVAVGLPPETNLPVLSSGSLPGLPADAVLTAKADEFFIYEGRVYNLDTLGLRLRLRPPSKKGGPAVLLVKADKNVSVQTIMQIFALAHAAGFTTVQLAGAAAPSSATPGTPL